MCSSKLLKSRAAPRNEIVAPSHVVVDKRAKTIDAVTLLRKLVTQDFSSNGKPTMGTDNDSRQSYCFVCTRLVGKFQTDVTDVPIVRFVCTTRPLKANKFESPPAVAFDEDVRISITARVS